VREEVRRSRPDPNFAFDLDEYELARVQSFRLIILRRKPRQSRPPSNFRLVERTRYYDVWKRDDRLPRVLAHLPLSNARGERSTKFCEGLANQIRAAGGGVLIAYYRPPATVQFNPGEAPSVSPLLLRAGSSLVAAGPGRVAGTLLTRTPGRYTAWLTGMIGRPVEVWLDGAKLGQVAYQPSYPDQFTYVGSRFVGPGRHDVELVRSGGTLHPGSDNAGQVIGPLVLEAIRRDRVVVVSPRRGLGVCATRRGLDWMEIVRSPRDRA
jgi:hypothetical protein